MHISYVYILNIMNHYSSGTP